MPRPWCRRNCGLQSRRSATRCSASNTPGPSSYSRRSRSGIAINSRWWCAFRTRYRTPNSLWCQLCPNRPGLCLCRRCRGRSWGRPRHISPSRRTQTNFVANWLSETSRPGSPSDQKKSRTTNYKHLLAANAFGEKAALSTTVPVRMLRDLLKINCIFWKNANCCFAQRSSLAILSARL